MGSIGDGDVYQCIGAMDAKNGIMAKHTRRLSGLIVGGGGVADATSKVGWNDPPQATPPLDLALPQILALGK
jgi:hypothetical protein